MAAWLCLTSGVFLANRRMVHALAGLILSLSGGVLGALALWASIMAFIANPSSLMVFTSFLALPPIAFPLTGFLVSFRYPMLNDVSTDLIDAPVFQHAGSLPENAGRSMDFPSENAELIRKGYPDLGPLLLKASPEDTYGLAVACAASEMPRWRITYRDDTGLAFEGVAETRLFHFCDDFVVRVRGDATGSRVDMRSKSRAGKNDFGANATRIRTFFKQLDRG